MGTLKSHDCILNPRPSTITVTAGNVNYWCSDIFLKSFVSVATKFDLLLLKESSSQPPPHPKYPE